MIKILGGIWLGVIIICIIEAVLSPTFITKLEQEKRKKNEHKSTN